jgi:predicted RNA-binding protein with PIN domain
VATRRSHRSDEESGLSYASPMEVAYTPKGQSADENILQRVEALSNRKSVIVITDDRGLKRQAQDFGANIMINSDFIKWLSNRARKKNIDNFQHKDSPHQINRLTKIFEERLKKTDFED